MEKRRAFQKITYRRFEGRLITMFRQALS